jgi:hypothetical protein
MKKIVSLALFLFCLSQFAEAQGWVRTYAQGDTVFNSLSTVAAKNDSFVIVGSSYTPATTGFLFVQKCDPKGIPVWQKRFPTIPIAGDTININLANDGGYVISIVTQYSADKAIRVVKIDELGNLIWQKKYNLPLPISYSQILPNKTKTGYTVSCRTNYLSIANNGDSLRLDSIETNNQPFVANSYQSDRDFVAVRTISRYKIELLEINASNTFG